MSKEQTAMDLLRQAAAEPTLDALLDRDPMGYSPADLEQIVQSERAERARILAAKEDRRAKREEE